MVNYFISNFARQLIEGRVYGEMLNQSGSIFGEVQTLTKKTLETIKI